MKLPRLSTKGHWFNEPSGRRILLRGVNLGGDCKVPFTPDQRTHRPDDFSGHRTVSFVGRPFPLAEADSHFERLRHWGFNCLRLLTTWEAVEHAGPGRHDTAYLDYFTALSEKAGAYGLYLFVDFHQDAWSRMSGGDGAPGWTFEAAGLDLSTFHRAGAAHVMQHKYDFAHGGRQEDRYPQMSWGWNYRMGANAIMWTLFFAGRTFAPDHKIEGENAEDYLQRHYAGAMQAIAKRLRGMDHVLGFDTLNEPSLGWIGKKLTERPPARQPGPAFTVEDALAAAKGETRAVPFYGFDAGAGRMGVLREETVNAARLPIWRTGVACPFTEAGALTREDYFTHDAQGRAYDAERDFVAPFFNRVAAAIRAERADFLVFAEFDPFKGLDHVSFPENVPSGMVNASHWYDIVTLVTKQFGYPVAVNPWNGKKLEGSAAIRASYVKQLARIKALGERMPGGAAPTLIGEFGIPYDLDGGQAYAAFAAGDRSAGPWEKQRIALSLMYDAMDELLLHTAQWNYTASNRNEAAIGDGWNQEDLSIYSADQATSADDPDSGGRAVEGFARPYVRAWAGEPVSQHYDWMAHRFEMKALAEPALNAPFEIFVPAHLWKGGLEITASAPVRRHREGGVLFVVPEAAGPLTVTLGPRPHA